MSKHPSLTKKSWKTELRVIITAGILVGQCFPSIQLAQAAKTVVAKDFLPPIASINPKLEASSLSKEDNTIEAIAFTAVSTPALHTTPKVERLADDISSEIKAAQFQGILEIQKKVDEADLESLWQATVEKNPVIRFSLEKLATPADLQSKQSSRFLNKTLSTLISGAALGATMLPIGGGGAYQNMGTMAVGNALQNIVNGKTQPTPNSLSPTEQIQLAGLVDELKLKLIHSYQDYKNTLQSLAQSHENTIKNNNLFSKALASKNELAIMAAGTAYYQALLNETQLRQKAKLARLDLERLAGPEAVSNLELAIHIPTSKEATASNTPTLQPKTTEVPAKVETQAPKAATASPLKPIDSEQYSIPNELPAAMEIGPYLGPEQPELIGPPMPVVSNTKAPNATRGKKVGKASNNTLPSPIPDKILEHKERR